MSSIVSANNTTTTIAAAIRGGLKGQDTFTDVRENALAHFEKLGLPGNKSEEYKHTPLARLLEKNFDFSLQNPKPGNISPDTFTVPGIEGTVLVFVNGHFNIGLSQFGEIKGVTIKPLGEASSSVVSKQLGTIADATADPFVAWNTAAWTDGIYIHVEKNVQVEKPVFIYHLHDTREGQVVSAVRNFVVCEEGSELTVFEKLHTTGSNNGFSSVVSEGIVQANAGLAWYAIQNDSLGRFHFDHRQIVQARSSRVNTFTFTLEGKAVRNNLHLSIDGEGIDSHMYGLYLLGGDTLADNHTVVDHRQPNSLSNEMYKGVIDDRARGVFNGKIFVRPNAQKTNAFQSNRNILLSDQATVNTKPQLEIWADDVKCSHGCTSGQLDEEALFYLRTRGIHEHTARAMMLYAFAAELLEPMKHAGIRNYIDSLISERLHKDF